ncbi:MAG: hypothetical protein ABIO40_05235 [Devosia sp.]
MSFISSAGTAMTHGMNVAGRQPGAAAASTVGWSDAAIGVIALIVVQGMLLAWALSEIGFDPILLRDLALVAGTSLAAPFIIFFLAAKATGHAGELPAIFLYLSLVLILTQATSAILSNFGVQTSVWIGIISVFMA